MGRLTPFPIQRLGLDKRPTATQQLVNTICYILPAGKDKNSGQTGLKGREM